MGDLYSAVEIINVTQWSFNEGTHPYVFATQLFLNGSPDEGRKEGRNRLPDTPGHRKKDRRNCCIERIQQPGGDYYNGTSFLAGQPR